MRALAVPFLLTGPVLANDIPVPAGGDVQAAIVQAQDGDRVLVAAGTYNQTIDFLGKAIEVIGVAGAGATTLDGSGQPGPVVRFHQGEGPASRLQGFTVTGADAIGTDCAGGGIGAVCLVSGLVATPTIADCRITGNRAQLGGGVAGGAVLERCVVRMNNTFAGGFPQRGGGLYGTPTLRHCVVANNGAVEGGGLYVAGGTARLEDCVLIDNFTNESGAGAGLNVASGAHVDVVRTVIASNFICCGLNSEFGAAAFIQSGGTAAFDRCTVHGNVTSDGEYGSQGGIVGPATVRGSVVRNNSPGQLTSVISVDFSNVEGGAVGTGNIDADPLFVDPGGLARDYHLDHGSPCIDAGDPAVLDPDGSRSDMGAHPFRTLYTRDNTLFPFTLDPGFPEISVQTGGVQRLRILAGSAHAFEFYLLAGSATGTAPGLLLLGQSVPLNLDAYFAFTLAAPNQPPLTDSLGLLDAAGRADAEFRLPTGGDPALAGLAVHHAALVGQLVPAPSIATVTSAEPLALVP